MSVAEVAVEAVEARTASGNAGKHESNVRANEEPLAEHRKPLALPRFDAETARSLGEVVANLASRRGLPVAVSIVRAGGPLYFCALEGSCADSAASNRRKQNTVLRFGKSSLEVGVTFAGKGWTLSSRGMAAEEYSLCGGGVPLFVADAGLVGAMAVSGLEGAADHELAMEALCWHVGMLPIQGAPFGCPTGIGGSGARD
jgi:uncharacterized protein (UPF0303 family)